MTCGHSSCRGPTNPPSLPRFRSRGRRDRVLAALAPLEPRGEGTFFVWLVLPDGWTTERLLTEARVALAPGEGFGERGAGRARLSLAVTDETLGVGLDRLRHALR